MTHTSVKTVGAGLTAAALLLLAGATPSAHADTGNWLMLSVSHGENTTAGTEDGTLLRCDPPGGGHPHAEEACAQLSQADGRITALPAEDALCPMIYAPVTAHAEGMWRDRPVTWTETFPNTCTLRAHTGRCSRWTGRETSTRLRQTGAGLSGPPRRGLTRPWRRGGPSAVVGARRAGSSANAPDGT